MQSPPLVYPFDSFSTLLSVSEFMFNLTNSKRKFQQELSITVWRVVGWDEIENPLFQEGAVRRNGSISWGLDFTPVSHNPYPQYLWVLEPRSVYLNFRKPRTLPGGGLTSQYYYNDMRPACIFGPTPFQTYCWETVYWVSNEVSSQS